MSTFKDANGMEWHIDIKNKHVDEIKRFCKGADGKPIDLLAVIAKGENLETLFNDVSTIVNIVFVVCYDQVKEHFDLTAYDKQNEDDYEMFPELKTENVKIKASRWFGGLLNGQALTDLLKAFEEALVNFCPSERLKAALKKMAELEEIQSEAVIQQIEEMAAQAIPVIQAETKKRMQDSLAGVLSGNWLESPESTPPRSPSGN